MDKAIPGTSGSTDSSSGTTPDTSGEGQDRSQDMVSYESHSKLLGEKKRRDQEVQDLRKQVQEFQSSQKDAEEKRLAESQEWKQLAELRQQEADEVNQKLQTFQQHTTDARKLDNFLDNLGIPLDKKYWNLVNIDNIVVDPNTNSVDELSLTKEIERFRANYPEVLVKPSQGKLPNEAATGVGGRLTYEEWKKLPAKEMSKRMSEVEGFKT